jgi:hypothetical protein
MTISSLVVVVRPNVAPDIRPPAPHPPIETEDENDTEIIGRTGRCINLSHSHSYSVTFIEKAVEQYRIVDKLRIVPIKDLKPTPAAFNPAAAKRYIDQEWMHYIQYKDEFGHLKIERFKQPEHNPSKGMFVMERNIKQGVK